jgi:hypothetical protein
VYDLFHSAQVFQVQKLTRILFIVKTNALLQIYITQQVSFNLKDIIKLHSEIIIPFSALPACIKLMVYPFKNTTEFQYLYY